jgi:hypothetical protein
VIHRPHQAHSTRPAAPSITRAASKAARHRTSTTKLAHMGRAPRLDHAFQRGSRHESDAGHKRLQPLGGRVNRPRLSGPIASGGKAGRQVFRPLGPENGRPDGTPKAHCHLNAPHSAISDQTVQNSSWACLRRLPKLGCSAIVALSCQMPSRAHPDRMAPRPACQSSRVAKATGANFETDNRSPCARRCRSSNFSRSCWHWPHIRCAKRTPTTGPQSPRRRPSRISLQNSLV